MERNGPVATIESTDFPVGASGSNGVPQFSKQLLGALLSLREGNFAVRLPPELTGLDGKIADAFNEIVASRSTRSRNSACVAVVGQEGKLKQRMSVPGAIGGWADEVAAINTLIDDLVWPTDGSDPRGRRRREGRPRPVDGARGRRSPARRRVPPFGASW